MVKPFSINELDARIRAVLRRRGVESKEKKITVGKAIQIDPERYCVMVYKKKVDLTQAEFTILCLLASRKEHVFTRSRMLDYLWGEEKCVTERTVDVHVRHLRQKLGKAGSFIKNVRGVGYKIGY